MNKRIRKKKSKQQLFTSIYSLTPRDSDVIVLEYCKNSCSQRELKNVMNILKHQFKDRRILIIPDMTTLSIYSDEELENMTEHIRLVMA